MLIALAVGIWLFVLTACQTNRLQPIEKEDVIIGLGSINGTRVGARGKPTIFSQLVLRFNKGEQVNILEEITIANPKVGEPREWLRVQVPPDCGLRVDPNFLSNVFTTVDINTKGQRIEPIHARVKVQPLEVRGGAGHNFPILGHLRLGDSVRLTGHSHNEWGEIYAPESTSIFVPAKFVDVRENATNYQNIGKTKRREGQVPLFPRQQNTDFTDSQEARVPSRPFSRRRFHRFSR